MGIEYPLINGHRYSYASAQLDFADVDIALWKELSYTHKLDPGEVFGAGGQLNGTTRGTYSAEGSLTLAREAWDELRDKLGDGYMEARRTIIVNYAEEGRPVQTDTLVGVRITEVANKPSQGNDGLTTEIKLHITYILENGKKPLRKMRL